VSDTTVTCCAANASSGLIFG